MLTDSAIKKAKPQDKGFRLTDSGGLSLEVTPSGGKLWRLRFRKEGKQQMLSLGKYPDVSLAEARAERDKLKSGLKQGIDPSRTRRIEKLLPKTNSGDSFEEIARVWHGVNAPLWTERHGEDVIGSLERLVFPDLGSFPITEITAPLVLATLQKIEKGGGKTAKGKKRGPAKETARRVRQRMSAVFVYAIASGKAVSDPAAIVQGAMAPVKKGRQPAITNLEDAKRLLKATDGIPAHPVTRLALRLLALTGLRPGTLITTPWSELNEIDQNEAIWRVSAERMKLRLHQKEDDANEHWVPMSRQAMEIIRILRSLTGKGPFAFPNTRHAHKPMSENAIGYLQNRAGFLHRHVPHGWRSTFSTIMNEKLPQDRHIIDLMLAHKPKDKVEAAYNRAQHISRRREIAQLWADLLLDGATPIEEIVQKPMRINNPDAYKKTGDDAGL
ncbi:integrase arm-type DNA-binding domain-containing protein [Brucella sp. TWI432]